MYTRSKYEGLGVRNSSWQREMQNPRIPLHPSRSALYVSPGNNRSSNQQGNNRYYNGSRNNKSTFKTVMESAVIVEYEPVSELERRIDEGVHYQPDNKFDEYQQHESSQQQRDLGDAFDNVESVKGIFCGYTSTQEEFSRLKSADPDDPCA